MNIRTAWERIQRLKEANASPKPPGERDIQDVYDEGERWLTSLLEAHGIRDRALDELLDICNENAGSTILNLFSLPEEQLRTAAIAAGIARLEDPPGVIVEIMRLRIAHSAGFTNGLSLGLELHDE